MRRSLLVLVLAALLASCHGEDIAPPELRRPIEALPGGARALLLASDLRNTWQRVDAHDLRAVLEAWPGTTHLMRAPALARFDSLCADFERRTGTRLQEDLVLNLVGDRAGLAVYPVTAGDDDVLLVGELRDPAAFARALAALRTPLGPGAPVVREERSEAGETWWRVEPVDDRSLCVVLKSNLVAVATDDELARRALALHAGTGGRSALADSVLQQALIAAGPHNLVALAALEGRRWTAHGFTWDREGLHFEQTTQWSEPPLAAATAGPDAGAIWASIPDGMTLAALVRRGSLGWPQLGPALDFGSAAADAPVRPASQGGGALALGGALGDVLGDWAGDVFGVALRGVEATPFAPVPDIALIVPVVDAEQARAGLGALESRLVALPLGPAGHGFQDATYGGRSYRTFVQPLSERVSPSWAVDGDVAIVATTRTLLHQILDTRRTGKRSVRTDGAFVRFRDFVPQDADAVFYANQRRLRHVVESLDTSSPVWGPKVEHVVDSVGRMAAVLEHFPAGAAYLQRVDSTVRVRGWMLEAD